MRIYRTILTMAVIMALTITTQAQAPQKFNYQGIARDYAGAPLANQPLGLKISILDETDKAVYVETHSVTTNKFGLYQVIIGDGAVESGSVSGIDWALGEKKIEVGIDPDGGTDYVSMGTTQLLSVPYALYAATSTGGGGSYNAGEGITITGKVISSDLGTDITTDELKEDAVTRTKIADNAVESSDIKDGEVKTVDIGNDAITAPKINDMGATTGQVLEWNGTEWAPATPSTSNPGWALDGNNASAGDFIGTTNDEVLRFKQNNVPAGFIDGDLTAFGRNALASNTTGSENTAIGEFAMYSNTTGDDNTAIGQAAMYYNTTGSFNTAYGIEALGRATTAQNNTAIGFKAGNTYNLGSNNTFLGANTGANADGMFNCIAIGKGVTCTANSQARIGNTATGSIGGYAPWTDFSDGRYKNDIQENVKGLEFILKLRPVTYHLDVHAIQQKLHEGRIENREASNPYMEQAMKEKEETLATGFIAQEVEKAARQSGFEFSGIDTPDNEDDFYGLRYAQFVVPIVKAVQEQQVMIEDQKNTIAAQQLDIQQLHASNTEQRSMLEAQQKTIEVLLAQVKEIAHLKAALASLKSQVESVKIHSHSGNGDSEYNALNTSKR